MTEETKYVRFRHFIALYNFNLKQIQNVCSKPKTRGGVVCIKII